VALSLGSHRLAVNQRRMFLEPGLSSPFPASRSKALGQDQARPSDRLVGLVVAHLLCKGKQNDSKKTEP